jgi:hypothetical protein
MSTYRVFIIRAWTESPSAQAARFLLEIPRTGERYGFVNIDHLLNALRIQLVLEETRLNEEAHPKYDSDETPNIHS